MTTNQLIHISNTLAYTLAYRLITVVDDHLTRNTCHYRNGAGRLLTTLDEVIQAILNDDLIIENSTQAAGNGGFSRKEQ